MIDWPLFVAFVAGSCYGEKNQATEFFLILPSLTLVFKSLWVLLKDQGPKDSQWPVTLAIGALISLLGGIGAMAQSDEQSGLFAILFLATWVSVLICANTLEPADIVKTFSYSGIAVVFIYIALSGPDLVKSLLLSGLGSDDIDRYTGPFGAHPNLIGHIAGCYCVAFYWWSKAETGLMKLVMWTALVCGLLICVAASSRGGLFAAVIAVVLTTLYLKGRTLSGLFSMLAVAIFLSAAALLLFPTTLDRLTELLDLNSAERGLNSGFSGRTDEWALVIQQFGTWNEPIIWGAGFRSAWLNQLTNAIDNGYITVAAEIGFIGLTLWLVQIGRACFAAVADKDRLNDPATRATIGVITFFLAESIVTRYFLALGNGASILLLILVVTLPSWRSKQRELGGAALQTTLYRI